MPNVFMATAVDVGEPNSPGQGPHVRDKQDVGKRLALAYRDNFVQGDGPFYTPGAVAASASVAAVHGAARGGPDVTVTVTFSNLPPGPAPLLPPTSVLGIEVSDGAGWDAAWVNATSCTLGATAGTVRIGSALAAVLQVRCAFPFSFICVRSITVGVLGAVNPQKASPGSVDHIKHYSFLMSTGTCGQIMHASVGTQRRAHERKGRRAARSTRSAASRCSRSS